VECVAGPRSRSGAPEDAARARLGLGRQRLRVGWRAFRLCESLRDAQENPATLRVKRHRQEERSRLLRTLNPPKLRFQKLALSQDPRVSCEGRIPLVMKALSKTGNAASPRLLVRRDQKLKALLDGLEPGKHVSEIDIVGAFAHGAESTPKGRATRDVPGAIRGRTRARRTRGRERSPRARTRDTRARAAPSSALALTLLAPVLGAAQHARLDGVGGHRASVERVKAVDQMAVRDVSGQGMTTSPLVSSEATAIPQEVTMIRLLTIVAATVAALAVSAAPASAGLLSSPLGVSATGTGYVANHTSGTVSVILGKQLTGKAKIIDGRHS
jgi:hypothetical protein